jgi:cytochrome P450
MPLERGGTLEYDPYSYELDADPYPAFKQLRDSAPVYRNERLDFYALTRFQDCFDAFLDWKRYSSARSTVLELMDQPLPPGSLMIFMDPPRQTRLRNLVSKAFTPRRIRELEPAIRRIARQYLDGLEGMTEFDVVGGFTSRLPMDVISTMLGIPEADRLQVQKWSNGILHREPGNPMPPASAIADMSRLHDYVSALLAEVRAHPRDDMLSALIAAEVKGEDGELVRLTDPEIMAFFNLLATAGNETVTKLLATAIYWLDRFPDERRTLVDDPSLIPGAVDETLRFDPPSQYQGRTLLAPVELHGTTMPEGAKVLLINAATGRDERQYPDPDRFDVRRKIDLHLNFGYGHHVCLGKNLALMESRIALEELLARYPEYAVSEDGIERMHSSNVRGFAALRIAVG